MSASDNKNGDKLTSAPEGEFHPHAPRSAPETTHGHKPGVIASAADRAGEFKAETLPAGSAPASRTFKPNPTAEVPATGASASDTIGGGQAGATSSTVARDTEFGHPEPKRNDNARGGLGGVGAPDGVVAPGQNTEKSQESAFKDERQLNKTQGELNHEQEKRESGDNVALGAEERVPQSADAVAAEASRKK